MLFVLINYIVCYIGDLMIIGFIFFGWMIFQGNKIDKIDLYSKIVEIAGIFRDYVKVRNGGF